MTLISRPVPAGNCWQSMAEAEEPVDWVGSAWLQEAASP